LFKRRRIVGIYRNPSRGQVKPDVVAELIPGSPDLESAANEAAWNSGWSSWNIAFVAVSIS
jgi:hypothetical protein